MMEPIFNLQDGSIAGIKNRWDEDYFVFWLLGNQCTYKCSYCPDTFHSGSHKYQPIEVIQRVLKSLPKSHVMFSGGEATFHPDFEKIVLEKPDHIRISVISNASRPIAFWERITEHLDTVVLTYHSEFANLDRFLETAKLVYLTHKRKGRINLTMIPEKWDICVNAYNKLKEAGLKVVAKPLVEDFGFKAEKLISGYTEEHVKWITEASKTVEYKIISVVGKNGEILGNTNPSELLITNQTNFKGWQCWTNTRVLNIGYGGGVKDTACKQREVLGDIYTGFTIPTEPKICYQDFCWCHSDIQPPKFKV